MEAHTRQCRTPLLAPVVCQLTTQRRHAGKGSTRVHPISEHVVYYLLGEISACSEEKTHEFFVTA